MYVLDTKMDKMRHQFFLILMSVIHPSWSWDGVPWSQRRMKDNGKRDLARQSFAVTRSIGQDHIGKVWQARDHEERC